MVRAWWILAHLLAAITAIRALRLHSSGNMIGRGKWEREKLCLAFEGIYSGVQNKIMTLKNLRCSQSVLFHCSCKVGWRGVENFAFFLQSRTLRCRMHSQEHLFPYEECFAPPPSEFWKCLRVNQVASELSGMLCFRKIFRNPGAWITVLVFGTESWGWQGMWRVWDLVSC